MRLFSTPPPLSQLGLHPRLCRIPHSLLCCLSELAASLASAGGGGLAGGGASRGLSTQPEEGSFKAQTRALLKLVHPDLFQRHPTARVENERSFKLLQVPPPANASALFIPALSKLRLMGAPRAATSALLHPQIAAWPWKSL